MRKFKIFKSFILASLAVWIVLICVRIITGAAVGDFLKDKSIVLMLLFYFVGIFVLSLVSLPRNGKSEDK